MLRPQLFGLNQPWLFKANDIIQLSETARICAEVTDVSKERGCAKRERGGKGVGGHCSNPLQNVMGIANRGSCR